MKFQPTRSCEALARFTRNRCRSIERMPGGSATISMKQSKVYRGDMGARRVRRRALVRQIANVPILRCLR